MSEEKPAVPYPIPPEAQAECDAWIASRPPHVRAVIEAYPITTCYRASGQGHYRIASYGEHADNTVTLTLIHGRDSFAPGVQVFGIEPGDIKRCDCGKWEPPTPQQVDAISSQLIELKRQRDGKAGGGHPAGFQDLFLMNEDARIETICMTALKMKPAEILGVTVESQEKANRYIGKIKAKCPQLRVSEPLPCEIPGILMLHVRAPDPNAN